MSEQQVKKIKTKLVNRERHSKRWSTHFSLNFCRLSRIKCVDFVATKNVMYFIILCKFATRELREKSSTFFLTNNWQFQNVKINSIAKSIIYELETYTLMLAREKMWWIWFELIQCLLWIEQSGILQCKFMIHGKYSEGE